VQSVLKFEEKRIVAGRVESGTLAAGDAITVWPSGSRGARRVDRDVADERFESSATLVFKY
jgi:sulfate adenylyltransferase subunit 1 (EFTu-like GTPase family)